MFFCALRTTTCPTGTPPVVWARESRLLANEVIEASRRAGADTDYLSRLQTDCRRHIGRSTANQFVWTRLRGASRAQGWNWIADCVPYLSWNPIVLSRLVAVLVLPRETLRSL